MSQAAALTSRIENELKNNILGFWMKNTIDEKNGGFLGEIDHAMNVHPDAHKSLVLNARILWTFSTAYRVYKDDSYLKMAERAYDYLKKHFIDRVHGGLFWMVDAQGNPSEDKKQIYGQSFAIYAMSEYYRAAGVQEALNIAVELFRILEKYGYDPIHKGYIEALARDWKPTDNLSLSDKDLNEAKSMNTHLHMLEGYTNLYRVWKNDSLKQKLAELIEVTLDHIVDSKTAHFLLFFDEEWNVKSDEISYGHDIEGSWLLFEAAEVLGDEAILERTKKTAIAMAEATYNEGVDADGGLINEANPEGYTNTNKDWWPQAEAVVGFYNAYQLTGDEKFADAAVKSWEFIENYIVDKEHGEWFWAVNREGAPQLHEMKVSAWKCPYHNSRVCFEMLERIEKTES